MALFNIKNEPRREITESLVGIFGSLFLIFIYFKINWYIVHTLLKATLPDDYIPEMIFFCILVCPVTFLLFVVFVYATHSLGEILCDWMKALGIDPRSKIRFDGRDKYTEDEDGHRTYLTTRAKV